MTPVPAGAPVKTRFGGMLLLMVAMLAGVAWVAVSRQLPGDPASDALVAPLVGYQAPPFTLPTTGGPEQSLATAGNNRPVVVNFWATWCGPCRAEMPDLQRVSQKYGGQVAILGVNQREAAAPVTEFALQMGVTYPLLLDESGAVNQEYNVRALPTTVFIGADGVITAIHTGIITQGVLEARIQEMLGDMGNDLP